jgi:hypothetical protein
VYGGLPGGVSGGESFGRGTYDCGPEGEPTGDVWELRSDGTLVVTPQDGAEPEEGTWTMQEGQVIINFSAFNNEPFDVEEDRLVFAGTPEPGPAGVWICTRAS